jgi:hypothetical protein
MQTLMRVVLKRNRSGFDIALSARPALSNGLARG